MMPVLDRTTSRVFRAAFGLSLLWLTTAGCDRATGVSRSNSTGTTGRHDEARQRLRRFSIVPRLPRAFP